MSRQTIITLAASAIIGVGCLATVSTDAFARGGRAGVGVGRPGVGVARVAPVRRGVAVGVGAAAVGAAAAGAYARCGYSPYPPCY
jgi:hypothetical protein